MDGSEQVVSEKRLKGTQQSAMVASFVDERMRDNSVKGIHNLREIRWNVPSVAVIVCM